jgi:hypothetical protein
VQRSDLQLFAADEVPLPAGPALVTVLSMPANTNVVPSLETRNSRADGVNHARDLVAWDTGVAFCEAGLA